jgi:hypothetical protein
MEFKEWDELTPLEQAQSTYSDLHKDYYGFRPRGLDPIFWGDVDALNYAINSILDMVDNYGWPE